MNASKVNTTLMVVVERRLRTPALQGVLGFSRSSLEQQLERELKIARAAGAKDGIRSRAATSAAQKLLAIALVNPKLVAEILLPSGQSLGD